MLSQLGLCPGMVLVMLVTIQYIRDGKMLKLEVCTSIYDVNSSLKPTRKPNVFTLIRAPLSKVKTKKNIYNPRYNIEYLAVSLSAPGLYPCCYLYGREPFTCTAENFQISFEMSFANM